ncbi:MULTISPECIES: NAD-dependent malic enzyme [Paraburkholderia]|uniref:NAD-dependent malic enzyme n=1 Tax=Paraburkholderia TaxID=1822464 RepID=UPI00224CC591|nr:MULTISPECIES: NAD-dependent malic enzyme [Paraburkholderia]MCX4165467.1 NAD-dependent malic enzyme [Paraburkholderia megapolitana]MDN7160959.1 NAD-dependent malic enzyme [Paraburkholderia sp. CHISQ3]MDQ6498006.1 NAD-dependent malic enzyme [Paraburkholderia megapolitana]
MPNASINAAASSDLTTSLSGYELLADPLLNKGTAFTEAERDLFDLHGLLPPNIGTLEEQVSRRLQVLRSFATDLERYAFLRELQDSNETLFFALLVQNLEELLPVVYTPTVGAGCQQFSKLFRKPRGLFLSLPHKNRIEAILAHPRFDNVEAIVVTDGERILGLGDQGAGGMGIPIGKLALYTGCGGLHPATTLPIMLDVGTDNPDCLSDPLYIGWRHERVRGQEYDDFIDAFVQAVIKRWPHVLLQWEDFAKNNATRMLERYRDSLCTFNDDVQGTAAVATGTLLSAINVTGVPLTEQRIAVMGAGSAGCGIASLIRQAMTDAGLSDSEAGQRFFMVDRDGLLVEGMEGLASFQQPFVQQKSAVGGWTLDHPDKIALLDVVRNAKPTVLIGVSGQPGAFSEPVVRAMAEFNKRPVIFPLSNPTSRAEATPEDLEAWSEGRAVIGTGSPFPPLTRNGAKFKVDQTNNSYIFPGVGLGAIAVKAERVTDAMFMVAAKALAAASPARNDPRSNLLPPVTSLREVSVTVALAVALQAHKDGLTKGVDTDQIEGLIRAKIWAPHYVPYSRTKSSAV